MTVYYVGNGWQDMESGGKTAYKLREYARFRKWTVAAEFSDSIAGTKDKRNLIFFCKELSGFVPSSGTS
jgi:hypothetical protein